MSLLSEACVGRSHRSKAGRARLQACLQRTRKLLGIPEDYRIGIVPGSDTGAMEMIMWSVLGQRGVDLFVFDSFGRDWLNDVTTQLRLPGTRVFEADYGLLPDLAQGNPENDWIFVWNGTTSGVRIPHGDWISDHRSGLTLCDATSAVFAMELPWQKLDAITFSWQKVLGGEAAHGMLILSPRAVERLQNYQPPWPIPKLFRMVKKGQLVEGIFDGATINTPSLLCVEDYLAALDWAEEIGGLPALVARSRGNLRILEEWVEKTSWVDFLAQDPACRSNTSVCLKIVAPWFNALDDATRRNTVKRLTELLEAQDVAYDIAAYRDAPPGLRIWAGATVEAADLRALTPWLDWAFETLSKKQLSTSS